MAEFFKGEKSKIGVLKTAHFNKGLLGLIQ